MANAERPLRALRAEMQRLLGERLADPATPLADLKDLQERLRLIDMALQRHGHWRSLLWPAVGIAVLLSAAALVPVPRVPFTLEASAGQVRLRTPQAGSISTRPADGEWRVEGYTAIDTPDARVASQSASGPLLLKGTVRLQSLQYPADTLLVVAAEGRHLRLAAEAASGMTSVSLQLSGPIDYGVADEGRRWSSSYPWGEWLRLEYVNKAGPPPLAELAVERHSDTPLQWSALRPEAVDFIQRQPGPGGVAQWTSSLRTARVVLPATRTEVALNAGDGLQLRGMELERGELQAGGDATLRLAGTASTIETQVGTYTRSLKPSILEWVARHHTLGLLWTAAVFLWAASAWLRKQWQDAA